MKSILYKTSGISFILAIAAVSAYAVTSTVQAEEISAEVNTSTSVSVPPPAGRPPMPLATGKPTLKAKMESRIEANGEARNNLLDQRREIRKEASTTEQEIRKEGKMILAQNREETRELRASTTDMFKRAANMRKEIKTKMEAKTFAVRKEALVKQLTLSIKNITSISARIDTRITQAEANGKTVTDAKALLVIANDKLAKAKTEVDAFNALTLNGTTTTTTTKGEVDLIKPRVLGDAAIKSVKEARDAFQKVIVALAHDLGEKLPNPSGTPTPTPSPSLNATASTSAAIQEGQAQDHRMN